MLKYVIVASLLFISHCAYADQPSLRKHLKPFSADRTVHHESVSSKTGNPIADMIVGGLIFLLAFPVLWFNERRYLINKYRITHAFDACKIANSSEVDPNLDQCLVFTTGRALTNEVVTDESFAVSEANCYKIGRNVEMLQWKEHYHTDDNDRTTYTYSLEWSNKFISSNQFQYSAGHENDQGHFVVESQTFLNSKVYVGQYVLSDSLKEQTTKTEQIQLNAHNLTIAQKNYGQLHKFVVRTFQGNTIYFRQFNEQDHSGDLRVSFTKVPCGDISIVSQQTGVTFQPWKIHDKFDENRLPSELQEQGACRQACDQIKEIERPLDQIDWVFEETLTKVQAFNKQLNHNQLLTDLVRFLGWIMMVLTHYHQVYWPLHFLQSCKLNSQLVPHFRTIFVGGLYILFWTVCIDNYYSQSLAISLPLALLTIAISWLYYRPLVGVFIFLLAGAIGAGLILTLHFSGQ